MKKITPFFICLLLGTASIARMPLYRGGGNNGPTMIKMISDLLVGYSSTTISSGGISAQGHGLCWAYGLGAAFQQGYEGHHRVVSVLLEYNGYDAKYTDKDTKNKIELITGYVSLPISYFRTMARDGRDLGFYYMATAIPQFNTRGDISGHDSKKLFNPFVVNLMASVGFGIPSRKPYAIRSYFRSGGRGYFTEHGTETRMRYAMVGPYVSYNINNISATNVKPEVTTNMLVFGLRYVVMFYE